MKYKAARNDKRGIGCDTLDLFADSRLNIPSQSDPYVKWTDERVERVKDLWKEGLSASQIANDIGGVSRNAVIGKIHRLGLSGRSSKPTPSARTRRERRAANAKPKAPKFQAKGNAAFRALYNGGEAEPYTPPSEELVIPIKERRFIATIEAGECRWPINDPRHADFHFCGKKQVTGLPYCEHHARRAFQPPNTNGSRPNLTAAKVGVGLIDRVNEFLEKEKA